MRDIQSFIHGGRVAQGAVLGLSLVLLVAGPAWSQPNDLVEVGAGAAPAPLRTGAPPAAAPVPPSAVPPSAPVDVSLGGEVGRQVDRTAASTSADPAMTSQGTAARAAAAARAVDKASRSAPVQRADIERAVFARVPVRAVLAVGRERLITLPAPAALHVPDDIDTVARIETIDRTVYVTALVPFVPIRIVAELIGSGQQIPLDIEASATARPAPQLEVFLGKAGAAGEASIGTSIGNLAATASTATTPALDMVALTRFAARMLYAPQRLAQPQAGVQTVPVSTSAVPGLVPGALVEAVPLAQWKSAGLYVTAVRLSNRSRLALELPLDQFRGQWLAVTAQHGRLAPMGSEADTTAVYLVCDRSFEACQ